MENTDPRYYEVLPTPLDDEELMPGDRVWLTYDLFQLGDWIIAYQVGKMERDLETEGRFELMSYIYDEPNKRLILKCRVRNPEEIPPMIYRAGVANLLALIGLLAGGLAMISYGQDRERRVYRLTPQATKELIDQIEADPNLTDEEKQRLKQEALKRMESSEPPSGLLPDMPGVGDLAAALVFVGLAVLAMVWFGGHK